ncbi:MAG: hypothetical protein M1828_000353 [Chrysothrix sp. TS-e1954]|nr:MAG: hypothetical protein M1828_000353 [Chrysothrix sp. TS-e1954]
MAAPIAELVQLFTRDNNQTASELQNTWSEQSCQAYDPSVETSYNYVPSLAPGVVFTVIFALSMVAHIAQTVLSRKWWYSSFAIGALAELMGWAARLAAHYCPYSGDLFSLQISILIIAPCFFSAGIYYILGQLIRKWGRQYSLISANLYLWIFITADLASIAIQGAGGGIASSASSASPPKSTATGTHIMIAGIAIQLASMSIFCILFLYTIFRARGLYLGGRDTKVTQLLGATIAGAALILIRNVYRAVELGQGWSGYLISHEAYFCVLDAGLMSLCVLIFNIFYPARHIDFSQSALGFHAKEPLGSEEEMTGL